MSVADAYPSEAAVQNSPIARAYGEDLSVDKAAKIGMKLDENRPISATTNTNCAGSLRNGNSVNPTAWTRNDRARILVPFPVLSRIPPQTGERTMVSIAGRKETREISEKDAPSERSWIGRKAQIIPVGPNARAVDNLTAIRWSVTTRPRDGEEEYLRGYFEGVVWMSRLISSLILRRSLSSFAIIHSSLSLNTRSSMLTFSFCTVFTMLVDAIVRYHAHSRSWEYNKF